MFLEIITPNEMVFEAEVESATLPGAAGSFQLLNDHAPMVNTLKAGTIDIISMVDKKTSEAQVEVKGGVVEVLNNRVLVMTESASHT